MQILGLIFTHLNSIFPSNNLSVPNVDSRHHSLREPYVLDCHWLCLYYYNLSRIELSFETLHNVSVCGLWANNHTYAHCTFLLKGPRLCIFKTVMTIAWNHQQLSKKYRQGIMKIHTVVL